jgi:hypothetical protein
MEAEMGKLSDAEKQGIIESQMKGYRVARTTPVDSFSQTAGAEDFTPDYKTLRESFLGDDAAGEDEDESTGSPETLSETFQGDALRSVLNSASVADDDDDIEIVPVEKESGADPWNRGARPKAVVLSSKDKKIIGSQG